MRPSQTPEDVKVLLPKLPVAGYTMVERSYPYGGEQSRRAIDLLIRRLDRRWRPEKYQVGKLGWKDGV